MKREESAEERPMRVGSVMSKSFTTSPANGLRTYMQRTPWPCLDENASLHREWCDPVLCAQLCPVARCRRLREKLLAEREGKCKRR